MRLGLPCFFAALVFVLPLQVFAIPADLTAEISQARDERHYDRVIEKLEQYRSKDPNDEKALLDLADAYLATDQTNAADALLEKYLQGHPFCFACYSRRWEVFIERKELPFIRQHLERLLANESSVPPEKKSDFLLALDQGYDALKDAESLRHIEKRILQEAPGSAAQEYVAQQHEMAVQRGQAPARDFIESFPKAEGIDSIYHMELGRLVREAKKDPEKIGEVPRWAKRWIKARPLSRKALYYSAMAYEDLGLKPHQTKSFLKRALRLIRDHGDFDREPFYDDAGWQARLLQSKHTVFAALAWHDFLSGHVKRAMRQSRRIESSFMHDGSYAFQRAKIDLALGYRTEAEVFFKQALQYHYPSEPVLAEIKKLRGSAALTLEELRDEARRSLGAPRFVEITDEVGLKGVEGLWVAWGDYDGDGREDLLIGGGGGLFHQERSPDGTIHFRNVWQEVTTGEISRFQAGVWGDLDRDGDLDLFLAHAVDAKHPIPSDRILINEKGHFIDRTAQMIGVKPSRPAAAAAWGDYDQDGYLDLYVANFERQREPIAHGTPDQLYHNLKGKRFEEVSKKAGCFSLQPMCGRGATWADFDNDGDLDLYVSNYRLDPNFLFQNQGNGKFREVAAEWGVRGVQHGGYFGHSIGSEFGDLDNDGDLDLVVCNLAHPPALGYSNKTQIFRNDLPEHKFTDTFSTCGIDYQETHSDPSLGDLDNDGDLDLIMTAVYAGRPLTVYLNDGHGHFTDATFASGIDVTGAWGAALADFDGDGDLDLLTSSDKGIRLFRNDGVPGSRHHWLEVEPIDRQTHGIVIGARVTVIEKTGRQQIREVSGGKGTGNQHSLIVEFGFGESAEPVQVIVRFPNGHRVKKNHVPLDQVLRIRS